MKLLVWILGIALIAGAVGFGFLAGDRKGGDTTTPEGTDGAVEASSSSELAQATEIEVEAEFIEIDPWLVGKRTTAPDPSELSFDNPITVYHADRTVTVYKLMRVTDRDGTVTESPVTMHASLAPRTMEISDRRALIKQRRVEKGADWAKGYKPANEPGAVINNGSTPAAGSDDK